MKPTAVLAALVALAFAGCPPEAPPPVEELAAAPAILSFKVEPARVKPGESVTLTWSTRDAATVELIEASRGVVSGGNALSGTATLTVSSDALFVLSATNSRGVRETAARIVEVETPEADAIFVAYPASIHAGEKTVLAWSAVAMGSVDIRPEGGESLDLRGQDEFGSIQVAPLEDTRYVLTAGDRSWSVDVDVAASVDVATIAPSPVAPGEQIRLSWKTTGASRVTVIGAGRGQLAEETNPSRVADGAYTELIPSTVAPAAAFSYVVRAHTPDGSFTDRPVTVYVAGAPVVKEWIVPEYVRLGGTFRVQWVTEGTETVEVLKDGQPIYATPDRDQAADGFVDLNSPSALASYSLRAVGPRGVVVTAAQKTVDPVDLPVVNVFDVTPGSVMTGGDPVTITWDITHARRVRIVAEGQYTVREIVGRSAASGTVLMYPNKDTTYVLEADNRIGDSISEQRSALIAVANPAGVTLNPGRAPEGASVTISATSAGSGDITGLTGVVHNAPGAAYVDISQTGTSIGYSGPDTTAKLVTLPEVFFTRLFGHRISGDKLSISINGWFAFRTTTLTGQDLPEPFPNDRLTSYAIAPYWDDLYDTANSEIYYQLDSDNGERRLIVQWEKVEYDPNAGSTISFQAQVYESGKVVFAYGDQLNMTGSTPSVGIVNGSMKRAGVFNGVPEEGDTVTLFGPASLPVTFEVESADLSFRQQVGTGFIEIDHAFGLIPAGELTLTEMNPTPAPGVIDGQWVEIRNNTANAFDLDGWTLDFGASTHTIAGTTLVPPNGYLLLGQSQTAGDGLAVAYVYGDSHALPTTGGITLEYLGAEYATLDTGSGTPLPGHAIQRGALRTGMDVVSGLTEMVCPANASSSYGTAGQKGTPGAPNAPCPNYVNSGLIPGAFESIALTGTRIVPSNTASESVDAITPPVPVRFGNATYATIYVNTNGFVTLEPHACTSATSCYPTNKSTISTTSNLPVGAIAPFWDNLLNNTGTTSGVYWQRKVPGVQPNDGYTIVSWEDWKTSLSGTSSYNFQIKFFDAGNIEFHYGSMTSSTANNAKGISSTTWLEVPQGGAAFKININSATAPGINPNTGYRFTVQ